MPEYVLGISAFCNDAAAIILRDDEIIAAAQEERFTRKKHDSCFPKNAIDYCLGEAGIRSDDLELVAFNDSITEKDVKKNCNFTVSPYFTNTT